MLSIGRCKKEKILFVSFFVRKKERRNESEENGTDWRLRGSLQRGNIKKQRRKT